MKLLSLKKITDLPTEVNLPASKSISNRVLILNALHGNNTKIKNLSKADDTILLQNVLSELKSKKEFYCFNLKNAGTTLRFLTAYLSVQEGTFELQCSERMKKRPIGELVEALKELGAKIEYLENKGFPPLLIEGSTLTKRCTSVSLEKSSQFASAIIMLGTSLEQGVQLFIRKFEYSFSYFKLTIKLLEKFGHYCPNLGVAYFSRKRNVRHPKTFYVEADWSASAVWFAFVSLKKKSKIFLKDLQKDSIQDDSQLVEIYKNLGITTIFTTSGIIIENNENIKCNFFELDLKNNPDLTPTLATNLCLLGINFRLSGLKNLKIKESDRIESIKYNLKLFGYKLYSDEDSLEWKGEFSKTQKNEIVCNSFDDHRIAMACSLFALFQDINLTNPSCVEKSYPNYFESLFQ